MGVIDIQRNHMTVFHIRLGERQGNRPAKLEGQLRVTSPNRTVVEAFCEVYGGSVRPWNTDQWEAYLPRTDLPIMVLPGQSVNQNWTLYRGSVCERRCEGFGGRELVSGKSCLCDPDIDKRMADKDQCSLETRLNFLCPEVAVVGAGTLVTRGRIAAETLPQAVAVAEAALRQGQMVPAVLRAVKHVGRNRQYVVPQIEIVGLSLQQLMAGEVGSAALPDRGAERAIGPSGGGGGQDRPTPEVAPVGAITAAEAEPDSSVSPPASPQVRQSIAKQANTRGITDEDLADMSLEVTGKYIEEEHFSVDDANALLAAVRKVKA